MTAGATALARFSRWLRPPSSPPRIGGLGGPIAVAALLAWAIACAAAPTSREAAAPAAQAQSQPATPSTAAPAAGARAERAVEPLKITVPAKSLTFLPFYFGKDQGLFREEGIDLELMQMRPTLGITAMEAEDVAFSAAPGTAMRAALQGVGVRAILFNQVRPSFSLVGQPGLTPDRVKTVAVSGLQTPGHLAAVAILRRLGRTDADEVAYFGTGDTAQNLQALAGHVADAVLITPPHTSMATVAGYTRLGDAFDVPDVQGGLAATERRLRDRAPQVKAVIRATLRAMDHIVRNDAEVVDYLTREFELDRPVAAGSYDILKQVINPDGDIDAATLQAVVGRMKQEGDVPEDVAPDRAIDLTLLREVRAEPAFRR